MCGCRGRGEALRSAARIVAAADGQGDGGAVLGSCYSKKPKSMRFNFARENLSHCPFTSSQVDWVPVLRLLGRSELKRILLAFLDVWGSEGAVTCLAKYNGEAKMFDLRCLGAASHEIGGPWAWVSRAFKSRGALLFPTSS